MGFRRTTGFKYNFADKYTTMYVENNAIFSELKKLTLGIGIVRKYTKITQK